MFNLFVMAEGGCDGRENLILLIFCPVFWLNRPHWPLHIKTWNIFFHESKTDFDFDLSASLKYHISPQALWIVYYSLSPDAVASILLDADTDRAPKCVWMSGISNIFVSPGGCSWSHMLIYFNVLGTKTTVRDANLIPYLKINRILNPDRYQIYKVLYLFMHEDDIDCLHIFCLFIICILQKSPFSWPNLDTWPYQWLPDVRFLCYKIQCSRNSIET